jgi:hypothetical protein
MLDKAGNVSTFPFLISMEDFMISYPIQDPLMGVLLFLIIISS